MLCPKKVTEKMVAANRRNAKKATGPRTDRGKNVAKFNATIFGLFARHVVIPLVDDADIADYATLAIKLMAELQPQTTFEEFYVLEIVKSMWKIRRAGLAEKALARTNALWDNKAPDAEALVRQYGNTLAILEAAEEEATTTGKLSASTYDAIANFIRAHDPDFVSQRRLEQNNVGESKETATPRVIVDDFFVAYLKERRKELKRLFAVNKDLAEQQAKDYYLSRAVPEIEIMEKILRYEEAARKNVERAYANLTELQERRKNHTASS